MFRLIRRLILVVLTVLLAAVGLTACNSLSRTVTAPQPDTLRIATHNVHYIILSRDTGPWSVGDWMDRRDPLDQTFKALDADVIGFQEMESFQRGGGDTNLALSWLLAQNPGFAAAAVGPYQDFPSTQPILYRTDRLTPIDQGWWFFSDTPDVIYSRTFDGSWPAFASWVSFADQNGERLRVVNVHFEYKSRSNQRKSAALTAERIAPWIAAGERVVLLGDINALSWQQPHRILADAGLRFVPVTGATYHLNRGLNLLGAIDHIALSDGLRAVGDSQVLRQKFGDRWPSDHYPVVVDVQFE